MKLWSPLIKILSLSLYKEKVTKKKIMNDGCLINILLYINNIFKLIKLLYLMVFYLNKYVI